MDALDDGERALAACARPTIVRPVELEDLTAQEGTTRYELQSIRTAGVLPRFVVVQFPRAAIERRARRPDQQLGRQHR
eukprot:5923824-Prymnesium_polylepis.2